MFEGKKEEEDDDADYKQKPYQRDIMTKWSNYMHFQERNNHTTNDFSPKIFYGN